MTTENKIYVGYTRIFQRNRDSKAKVVINVGGARSSKSYSLEQLMLYKLATETGKVFGITRKTFPALRMTCMQVFFDLAKAYGMYQHGQHNKTFNTFEYNGNRVQFFGLDESEKIKSTEFNYIWMEEANEFSYTDYINLKLRLSGQTHDGNQNHMYLSLNPIDSHNWIATRASNESDVELIHSTFMDNPYLSNEYKALLLDLINQDENAYRVYVLGEWGHLEGLIYSNYKVIPALPDMPGAKWCYGLDFGSTYPSALIKVINYEGKWYLDERIYQEGLTTADIIEKLSHEPRGDIYGDPTAKMMLAEIRQAGYTAYEGVRDVKAGIDLCQRQTLYIPQDSYNIIREVQNYKWKKDKNSLADDAFLPEPVKYNDHAMDAMRYAIWGMTQRYGYATAQPRDSNSVSTLNFGGTKNDHILQRWLKGKR